MVGAGTLFIMDDLHLQGHDSDIDPSRGVITCFAELFLPMFCSMALWLLTMVVYGRPW